MEGYCKGELCNRDGCTGIIKEKESDGGCCCHINPPCSYCETAREYCSECDWDAKEEYDKYENERLKAVIEYNNRPEVIESRRIEEDKRQKEEEEFWEMYTGKKPVDKYRPRHKGHTHFSHIIYGIHPNMTRSEIEKQVRGTFGGRFKSFTDHSFEYVAYTD